MPFRWPPLRQTHPLRSPLEDLPPVLIVGLGWLGTAVTNELRGRGASSLLLFDGDTTARSTDESTRDSLRDAIGRAGVVISCSDGPSSLPRILSDLCEGRVPLIACELTDTGARLQIVNGGAPGAGCVSCDSEFRARRGVLDAAVSQYLEQHMFASVPWRYRHRDDDLIAVAMLTTLAVGDAVRAVESRTAADTRVHVIDFDERTTRAHSVPRHFACRRCWPRSSLTIDALRDEAQGRWASAWETSHPPRDLAEIGATLRSLVDPQTGLFERAWVNGAAERRAIGSFLQERGVAPNETPFMDAARVVVARSRLKGRLREPVISEGFDFTDPHVAEALALIEGLERVFALDDIDPSRVVRAAYAAVDGMAIDPREIPLFSDEQYATLGSRFGGSIRRSR